MGQSKCTAVRWWWVNVGRGFLKVDQVERLQQCPIAKIIQTRRGRNHIANYYCTHYYTSLHYLLFILALTFAQAEPLALLKLLLFMLYIQPTVDFVFVFTVHTTLKYTLPFSTLSISPLCLTHLMWHTYINLYTLPTTTTQ